MEILHACVIPKGPIWIIEAMGTSIIKRWRCPVCGDIWTVAYVGGSNQHKAADRWRHTPFPNVKHWRWRRKVIKGEIS